MEIGGQCLPQVESRDFPPAEDVSMPSSPTFIGRVIAGLNLFYGDLQEGRSVDQPQINADWAGRHRSSAPACPTRVHLRSIYRLLTRFRLSRAFSFRFSYRTTKLRCRPLCWWI